MANSLGWDDINSINWRAMSVRSETIIAKGNELACPAFMPSSGGKSSVVLGYEIQCLHCDAIY